MAVHSQKRQITAITLGVILSLLHATVVHAQSSANLIEPDTRSPVIELEAVSESLADSAQVFTAQVVDDRALKDVTLYHRRAGQQPFTPLPMNPIGSSGYYTVTVETNPSDLRSIEYYVQARDQGGNRTVEGYAFDPYTRILLGNDANLAAPVPVAQTNTPAQSESSTGRIRWWHVAIGVVVAGALASAASGSDGGGEQDNRVPLSVTATGF